MTKNLNNLPWNRLQKAPLLVAGLTGGAYYLGVILAVIFVNPVEKIAFFWPSNALAAAVLILIPRRHWPLVLAAVSIGYIAGRLPAGNLPLGVYVGFCIANLIEITVVAWLVKQWQSGGLKFSDLGRALPIVLISSVPAAFLSAMVGAGVVSFLLQSADFFRAFGVWFTGDLFGLILVTPLALAIIAPNDGPRLSWVGWLRTCEGVSLAAGLAGLGIAVSQILGANALFWPMVPYLVFPFLLWLAFRVDLFFAILGTFMVGLFQVWATYAGFGLFKFQGMSLTAEVVIMKVCITLLTVLTLVLAVRRDNQRQDSQVV